LRILFKSPRESPEVVLVYNIEDVVYKDFALPKIISSNKKSKLFGKQVEIFMSRDGDYVTTTSEKKSKSQLACESVKLQHDLSFASQSLGCCSTVMQQEEGLTPGRLAYSATFGSAGAVSSAGNDFFKDDSDRSSNEDLSGFDESTSNVGSSTGLSLYSSRRSAPGGGNVGSSTGISLDPSRRSAPGGGNVGSSTTGLSFLAPSRSAPGGSSNVGSSTGLSLSTSRQQQDDDANSAESWC
jgi:hypothetical protein